MAFYDADGARVGASSSRHEIGILAAGPMVRLLDLRGALASRGYLADGELTIRTTDFRARARPVARKGPMGRKGRGPISCGSPCATGWPR